MSQNFTDKEHLVIIGGGFAGLKLLNRINKDKYRVTLVDCHNYHSFPPLFYQIASAGIEPAGICFPHRAEIKRFIPSGARFRMMRITNINTTTKTISDGKDFLGYDKLIIAAGSTNNFFGISGLEDSVHTLKSTPEAIRLRNDILSILEKASLENSSDARRKMLRFVVIGGGPTGVETAGALGEMKRFIISRQYPDIDPDDISIKLIEGSHRLLGSMSRKSSMKAARYLNELDVEVITNVQVNGYSNGTVTTSTRSIPASMVIWTAGVTSVNFNFTGNSPAFGRGHRILVDRTNKVSGLDDVYAIGDIACITGDTEYPYGHPQVAQVAIQQASNLAKNLNLKSNKKPILFQYKNKGNMATVGRNRAVVDLPGLHFGGFAAWLTWMFIHLMSILGIRNKITVLINWSWGYFTYGSSLRMLFKIAEVPHNDFHGNDTV